MFLRFTKELYREGLRLRDFSVQEFLFLLACRRIAFIKGLDRAVFSDVQKDTKLNIYVANTPNHPLIKATGKSFTHSSRALVKASAEACERFSWYNFYPNDEEIVEATFNELKSMRHAIPPLSFAGLDLFEKEKVYNESTLKWIPISELGKRVDDHIFCPLQILSPKYYTQSVCPLSLLKPKEPVIRVPVTTGVAAGLTEESAILGGILEIIERDAFMNNYLTFVTPRRIKLEGFEIGELVKDEALVRFGKNIEIHALLLETDFPVHVVCAAVVDRSGRGRALSLGLGTNFSLENALRSAFEETFTLHSFASLGKEYKLQIPEIINLDGRRILWSKTETLKNIDFFLAGKANNIDFLKKEVIESVADKDNLQKLNFLKKEIKYDIFYKDITAPEVTKTGLKTFTAVIPELQPLHLDERTPNFFGERLNWAISSKGLNKFPHPFL